MTDPQGARYSLALLTPLKWALIFGSVLLAYSQNVVAADCATGNCPPSSAERALCKLPATDLSVRQGIDPNAPVTFNTKNSLLDATGNLHFTDGVELRQGNRTLRAQEMHYDSESDSWMIPGSVELSDPNLTVRGQSAQASTEAGTVDFEATSFELPARFGRGSASHIRLSHNGEVELRDAVYTTCPGPKPDWELKTSELKIDADAQVGSVRNPRLDIKGIPILYLPFTITLPIGDERKSGFLTPSFGTSSNSGAAISTPVYWNIAPNYDATITPTWYPQRGVRDVDLGTEFRFLTHVTRGVAQVNYLPNDQVTGTERSYLDLHAQTDFTPQLRLYTDGTNVSDTAWLEDFGSGLQRNGVTVLPRTARLIYRSDEWSLAALTQNYQTIDSTIPIDERPYTLLPQLSFNGWFPDRAYGLTYSITGEYSNFQHSTNSSANDGQRFDVTPEVRLPLRRGGFYLEPSAAWRYTAERLDQPVAGSNDTTPTRSAPVFSLDSGVVFERPSGSEQQRVQTLEPRLLYLYVPYRNQDNFQVFDTNQPDFNLVQLFGVNRYLGPDRLGDANQVAVGVTSRLLDAGSGKQFMSATLGEIYRFTAPRVSLPGEVLDTNSVSDIVGELQLTKFKDWNAGLGLQWDPNSRGMQRTDFNIQYLPAAGQVINAGYVYRKEGLDQQPGLEQIDTSAAWPVGHRVKLYGSYVYSLLKTDRKMIAGLIGVEYRDCCWGFRFVAGRSVSLTGQLENHMQWQIELNGLSSVGSANDAFLGQSIRGYSAARFDSQSVP